jgi:hypothetical protein
VFVGTYDDYPASSPFTPQAVNNKVINNKISGFVIDVATEDDSATKIHANRPAS